eukprot:8458751-Pyramimonas_sp.AAC.1
MQQVSQRIHLRESPASSADSWKRGPQGRAVTKDAPREETTGRLINPPDRGLRLLSRNESQGAGHHTFRKPPPNVLPTIQDTAGASSKPGGDC